LIVFYDIVVSGIDKPEVIDRLHKILRKLAFAGLTVRKQKCEYYKTKITFLGYSIDEKGLHIPTDRIKAISDVPTPKNVHESKVFLGLVNYYGKFVPNMYTVASPLYALLRNNVKFVWGNDQQKGFDEIKNILLSNKVLIHYNTDFELILACEAQWVWQLCCHIGYPMAKINQLLLLQERYQKVNKDIHKLIKKLLP